MLKSYYGDVDLINDTTLKINIVKAEKLRLYNPKLDTSTQNVVVFGKTSHKKMLDVWKSYYDEGTATPEDAYKATKEAFTSTKSNSEGTLIMFQFPKNEKYYFEILFSKDDEYYDTYESVGKFVAKTVYNDQVNEVKQKIKDAL